MTKLCSAEVVACVSGHDPLTGSGESCSVQPSYFVTELTDQAGLGLLNMAGIWPSCSWT